VLSDLELSVMRIISVTVVAMGLVSMVPAAQAFDKFIPLGVGYSTELSELPALDSEEQSLTNQADIYETEIYNKQLEQQRHNNYINHFLNDQNSAGSDFSLDY
jgi:hypothetical protein